MKAKLFNELPESVREAGRVIRGERKAHRETRLDLPEVKAIRPKQTRSAGQKLAGGVSHRKKSTTSSALK